MMMGQPIAILAASEPLLTVPAHWPAQLDLLNWCQNVAPGTAALLVLAGIVFLLFGYYLFRWLVVLNGAILGFLIGEMIGVAFGAPITSGILGGVLTAVACWPLMKYAVAVMGAIVGGIVGASLWLTFGQDPHFAWAGAMTGMVFFGMLVFIVFRGSVIMYMSLQGSMMLILGLLGLIYKYQELGPKITNSLTANSFVMPMVILIPALLGLVYQQHKYPEVQNSAPDDK